MQIAFSLHIPRKETNKNEKYLNNAIHKQYIHLFHVRTLSQLLGSIEQFK